MEAVRKVKLHLTQATKSIGDGQGVLDALATQVRGHLGEIDALLAAEAAADDVRAADDDGA